MKVIEPAYKEKMLEEIQEPIKDVHFIKCIDIDIVQRLLVYKHPCWSIDEVKTNRLKRFLFIYMKRK
ncbi:hypothetical protein C1N55_15525 [Lysinibacillus sp. SGAir0095]|nr:hypothetical protein C1N55_15525 [Lysinibacillus sp. SGAir0095]